MGEIKLKPCPFCGSHNLNCVVKEYCCYVQCNDCGANGGKRIMDGEKAVEAWNKRVVEDGETK